MTADVTALQNELADLNQQLIDIEMLKSSAVQRNRFGLLLFFICSSFISTSINPVRTGGQNGARTFCCSDWFRSIWQHKFPGTNRGRPFRPRTRQTRPGNGRTDATDLQFLEIWTLPRRPEKHRRPGPIVPFRPSSDNDDCRRRRWITRSSVQVSNLPLARWNCSECVFLGEWFQYQRRAGSTWM